MPQKDSELAKIREEISKMFRPNPYVTHSTPPQLLDTIPASAQATQSLVHALEGLAEKNSQSGDLRMAIQAVLKRKGHLRDLLSHSEFPVPPEQLLTEPQNKIMFQMLEG